VTRITCFYCYMVNQLFMADMPLKCCSLIHAELIEWSVKLRFYVFFQKKSQTCVFTFFELLHTFFSNTALSLRRTVRLRPLRLVPSKCLAGQQQTETCTHCCSVTIRPRQSSSLVSNLYIQLYFTNICGSTT